VNASHPRVPAVEVQEGDAVFDNATEYLQTLSDLLAGAVVTDAQGTSIGLDDGTARATMSL